MNQPQIEQFRINLLLQLEAAGSNGLSVEGLVIGARIQRHSVDDETAKTELDYLIQRGLVRSEKERAVIGPGFVHYHVTPDGRDFLAENGYRATR